MVLLALCTIATLFGIVMIASAAQYDGNSRYLYLQSFALIAGVLLFFALTLFDIDILAGQRPLLFLFNTLFLLILLVWGVEGTSGNRSWLHFSWLPFNIQPAEVCKITYIVILAKTMSVHRNRISSVKTVSQLTFHMLYLLALIVVISSDLGVALIFIFIFLVMAYVGGVSGWWFLGGAGALAVAGPYVWQNLFRGDQKLRIQALFDPSIDPTGEGVLWQTNKCLEALRNGGLSGQGLFHGDLTAKGNLPAQHTDSIFASIGEQLGLIGCLAVLLLLLAIVARCIYVGMKSPDYMNRLICIGIAAMLLFQIVINVGMCIGLFPIIGLALPFFSYGGTSIITSFIAMGIVSGIKMRPEPDISAHYIRPY
jgi:rod shape determining protein RodA